MKKNNIESQPSQVLRSDNVTISSRKGCFLITASALLELWISCTAYSSWSTLSYSTIFLVKKKKLCSKLMTVYVIIYFQKH